MKKVKLGSIGCIVEVVEDFTFTSDVKCSYERDTIAYAAEKFFAHSYALLPVCMRKSWKLRYVSGGKNNKAKFEFPVPAVLMELPGQCALIGGFVDSFGIHITSVKLSGTRGSV